MGGTARQFNKMYIDYKQQFKKPIHIVASLMPQEFSDDDFIATFKRLYLTEQTLKSQWCPWELGYADALGKKICIFQRFKSDSKIPEFYSAYPKLVFSNQPIIRLNGEDIPFDKWIQQ